MSSNFFKVRNGVNVGILSADPSGGTTGDMYYNSSTGKLRQFVNGAWRDAVSADDTQTLSNKTLDNTTVETIKDSNLTVQNSTDISKQVKLDLSGVSTGTTRTLTVPDASTTLVGTAVTQTLSNKTLDNTTVETIKDSNLTVQNATDTTKQAKFDASGITTGTTRTYGLPDVSSSLLARTSTDTGANRVQNKDLDDSNVEIVNNADNTKKLKISAASISTGTTRTLTAPDATDTIAVLAATQALSSKQISYSTATDSTTTGADATLQAFTTGIVRLTNASLTSVGGIPAGGSGQQLVLENKTGNQIQINNEDAVATAANRIQTGTGAPLSMPNNATVILSYDSTSSRWQLASGSGSGSGSGTGKNYLSAVTTSQSITPNTGNGNFELGSTAGWSLGTVGTLTNGIPTGTPTFGSGASGNLSISVVSSGQLAGTYSLSYASSAATTQGNMLASDAFNIDNEDQAKVLTWKFYYKAQTNPGNANWSGTSSNSFGVAVYDVTNASWLSSTANFAMVQSSGIGYATGTCQTNATTTQLRFVMYNVNATTGAITVYFDDFSVGPQTAPMGPAMSDWVAYTPTLGAGYGTPSQVQFWSRRVGGELEVRGGFTAGTVSAASASISIGYNGANANVTIDTTKIAGNVVNPFLGDAVSSLASTTLFRLGIAYASTTTVTPQIQSSTQGLTTGGVNANSVVATGGQVQVNFKVPIVGWSSNTSMSSDTDTRVVAMVAASTSTQSVTSGGGDQQVTAFTTTSDTHGAFSSNTYTVPVTGYYQVNAEILWGIQASSSRGYIAIAVNGINSFTGLQIPLNASFNVTSTASTVLFLSAGNTVTILANTTVTTSLVSGSKWSMNRLSGPSVIAATESVNMSYTDTSGAAIGTSAAPFSFNTKLFDSHNAYSGSTYTVPVSGKYRISAQLWTASVTLGTGSSINLRIYHNGTSYVENSVIGNGGTNNQYSVLTSGTINCLAGDTIQIYASSTVATNGNTTAGANLLSIERVGN